MMHGQKNIKLLRHIDRNNVAVSSASPPTWQPCSW